MRLIKNVGSVLGGSLLIAATTIGVGMLGLPIATGPGGFFLATLFYLFTWGFMLCTGLLLLEVCIWMPTDANLITMTHRLLGPIGKIGCWLVYLFLFLTAMVAHMASGGATMVDLFGFPREAGMVIYVLLFSPVVYKGVRAVERFNSIFMLGALATYFSFLFFSFRNIDFKLLTFVDWHEGWSGIPVLLTAFTYQLIIPTLMTYMDRNVKKVRLSIILGSSIPLVVYIVWEFLILGIIPIDRLLVAKAQGDTAVMPLREILHNPWIFKIGTWFAFFVLTTSYLAMSLAFLDFLTDGLKAKKRGWGKWTLCFLIFAPPMTIALIYPGIFIKALEYVGGISCALIFGLLPPLMVWVGRYLKKYDRQNPQLPGGKPVLFILMGLVCVELIFQIVYQLH